MEKFSKKIVWIIFFLKILEEGKFIFLLGINEVWFGREIKVFKEVVALIFDKRLALADATVWFIEKNGWRFLVFFAILRIALHWK